MPPRMIVAPANGPPAYYPRAYLPLVPNPDLAYAPPDTTDILTAPSRDILARQTQRLAPRGRSWNTDEAAAPFGSKNQHGVWSLVGDGLAVFYGFLTRVVSAAFPGLADEDALAQWEFELGIPDGCGTGLAVNLASRRRVVQSARVPASGFTRSDIVDVGLRLATTLRVDERHGFQLGLAQCGGTMCGGDATLPFTFLVNAPGSIFWMECGATGLGQVPLGQYSSNDFFCLIDRLKHAHTQYYAVPSSAV
jgi:uncharacterized protein YmfQ (DUF2313 family)